MNDRYLIVEMDRVVTKVNPNYPMTPDLDYKPLHKIAEFIYAQMKLHRGPENNAYEILPIWEQLYTVAYNDQFYKDKSLSTIANHIQEFYQKALSNGKSTSQLKNKLAARLKSRQ